jgi:hypothetical protein
VRHGPPVATTEQALLTSVPIMNQKWDSRSDMTADLQLHALANGRTVVTDQEHSDGQCVTLVCAERITGYVLAMLL